MPACRYHRLHPEYIVSRMKEILRSFRLRVVLCHVDVEDPKEPLGQVNKLAALNGFTLLCGFSQKVRLSFLHAWCPSDGPAEVAMALLLKAGQSTSTPRSPSHAALRGEPEGIDSSCFRAARWLIHAVEGEEGEGAQRVACTGDHLGMALPLLPPNATPHPDLPQVGQLASLAEACPRLSTAGVCQVP